MNSLRIRLSLVILLTFNLVTAWAATTSSELARLVPDNTIFLISCSGGESLKADFEKTIISKVCQDPQVKVFVEQLTTSLQVSSPQVNGAINMLPLIITPIRDSQLLSEPLVIGAAYDNLDIENEKVNGCIYIAAAGGPDKRAKIQNMVQSFSFLTGQLMSQDQTADDYYQYDFPGAKLIMSGTESCTFITFGMADNADKYMSGLIATAKKSNTRKPEIINIFDKFSGRSSDIKIAINTPLIISELKKLLEIPEIKSKLENDSDDAKIVYGLLDIISPMGKIGARIGFNDSQIEVENICENFGNVVLNDCMLPVNKSVLRAVSKDVTGFYLTNVNLEKVIEQVKSLILQFDGQETLDDIAEGLEDAKSETGIDLSKTIFTNFTGELLFSSNGTQTAAMLGSSGYAILGVKDCDLMIETFQKLIELLKEKAGADMKVSLVKSEYNGYEINSLILPQVSIVGLQPAFAKIDDNHILITSNISEAIPITQLLKAADSSNSILSNPKYIAASSGCPDNAFSVSYSDTSRSWNALNTQLSAIWPLLSMGLAEQGIVLPPMLPNVSYLMADAPGTISWSAFKDKDLISYNRGLAVNTSMMNVNGGSAAIAVSILMPALSRAKTLAKNTVCQTNLKGIGVATVIYMNDHKGKAPDTLEELTEADLTEKSMICPECEEKYTWCGKGLDDSCPFDAVLAYCECHLDDDLGYNVLYADAHVAKVDEEKFIEVMKKNNTIRKQLGLEQIDIPGTIDETEVKELDTF